MILKLFWYELLLLYPSEHLDFPSLCARLWPRRAGTVCLFERVCTDPLLGFGNDHVLPHVSCNRRKFKLLYWWCLFLQFTTMLFLGLSGGDFLAAVNFRAQFRSLWYGRKVGLVIHFKIQSIACFPEQQYTTYSHPRSTRRSWFNLQSVLILFIE